MTECVGLQGAARGGKKLRGLQTAVMGLCAGCARAVRGCTGTNMCCQLQEAAVLCMVEVSEGKSPSVTA